MATFLIITTLVLLLAAIFTGGYNKKFLERVQKSWIWGWITTVDHKRIGILYIVASGFFFILGGVESILIRLQLIWPGNEFITGDAYNQLLTMHGTTMIFFVAMPLLIGLMNYIVPLQIGARDVAFPFANALSFWLFLSGAILMNLSFLFGGAPDAGWTSYTPLALNEYSPGPGVDYYVLGLQIAGIGTILGGVNFITTIVNMRAPGMTFLRLPLFTWTTFVTSAIILFALPPLAVNLLLLQFDRLFGAHFFSTADFWPSGSIFGDFACLWNDFRSGKHFFQKKVIWIYIHGICHSGDWLFKLYGLGPPYVYRRAGKYG